MACGVSAGGVSVFGVSACDGLVCGVSVGVSAGGVSAFGASACDVLACGVSACGVSAGASAGGVSGSSPGFFGRRVMTLLPDGV